MNRWRFLRPSIWLPWVPLVNVLVVLILGSWGLQWKADQDARLELLRADHEAKLELLKHDLGAAHLVLTLEDDPRARNVQ